MGVLASLFYNNSIQMLQLATKASAFKLQTYNIIASSSRNHNYD